jgi:hypothetical protein
MKDFMRFYIMMSEPQLMKQLIVDFINIVAKWFFAGFTQVTSTKTDAKERSEIYKVSPYLCLA